MPVIFYSFNEPGILGPWGLPVYSKQGFGSAFFFADPAPDPGKNFHADPDPAPDPDTDPGGIRGRGLGVKGKNDFFFLSFFHASDDS